MDADRIRATSTTGTRAPSAALPEPPIQIKVPQVASPVAERTQMSRNSMPGGLPFDFSAEAHTTQCEIPQVTIKTIPDRDEPTIIGAVAGTSRHPCTVLPEPGEDSQAHLPLEEPMGPIFSIPPRVGITYS